MKVLLAIDDDPARYQHLSRKLERHGIIVACVQNPDAVEILLDSGAVFAVMLDHDMPEWDGQHYAREILSARSVPVCVSSANHAGARAIASILSEYGTPYTIISVTETAADERWLGWVLDALYGERVPPDLSLSHRIAVRCKRAADHKAGLTLTSEEVQELLRLPDMDDLVRDLPYLLSPS